MRMKSFFFSEEDEEEEEHKGWSAMVAMCKPNLQPLLEEGKRNGARRISGGILGTIPLRFSEQQ